MVSQPTGRPRGHPSKQRQSTAVTVAAEKGERGRLELPFLKNPSRFFVALIIELHWFDKKSLREAAKTIAAIEVGNEVNPSDPEAIEVLRRCPEGMVALAYGPKTEYPDENGVYRNTRRGGARTIQARADYLRQIAREALRDPDCQFWLRCVPTALRLLRLKDYLQFKGAPRAVTDMKSKFVTIHDKSPRQAATALIAAAGEAELFADLLNAK